MRDLRGQELRTGDAIVYAVRVNDTAALRRAYVSEVGEKSIRASVPGLSKPVKLSHGDRIYRCSSPHEGTLNALAARMAEIAKSRGFGATARMEADVRSGIGVWRLLPLDAREALAGVLFSGRVATFAANLVEEIAELWAAYRRGMLHSPCDKAESMRALCGEALTCLEEELADVAIRTLDTAHALGVDLDRAVRVKAAYNATRPFRHGGKLA